MRVLVLNSSRFGHTARIAERVAQRLRAAGHDVAVEPLGPGRRVEVRTSDAVILGASIRYGHFAREVWRFASRNARVLEAMPNAFFGVNLVAAKPGKDRVETNAYMRKFSERSPWRPGLVEVFAGELDYPAYNPVDRRLIQMIMRRTGKPTDPTFHGIYTDWERVDRFADEVAALLAGPAVRG